LIPAGQMSAVVTCHDSGPLLLRAIDSIRQQGSITVVLVDDGSTSCVCERVAGDVVRIRKPHSGQGASLNAGIARVDTPFVSFLDDDDEWIPGKASRQWELLRASTADAVVGGVINMEQQADGTEQRRAFLSARVLGAMTFLTAAMRRVGPFDESRRLHGIIDWWSRADTEGINTIADPEPALLRRIHGSNIGLTQRARARQDLLHHLRAHRSRIRDSE